jgi:Ca-activated chloride channel family protein
MRTKLLMTGLVLTVAALVGIGHGGWASRAHASGLLIADGGFGGVLEIKEQDVSVVINNGIAVTEIKQIFLNTENRIVEALYTFPVPNGASVSNFSMVINGKEMVGEVVEKKRARQIYESYKATRVDPGLLEQVDYKTFELRVFPIAAGAEQHIKITYYQQLDFDHNNATYVYPLATTTRTGINETTQGRFALTLDVKSEIPITKVFSPSHEKDFVISSHTPNYSRASLEVDGGDLSRDVVIAFDTQRPRTGIDIIANKQAGEDGYFMLTMTAGKELEEYGAGMDYVFVVDISGSMAGEGKLTLARNVVDAFVGELGSEDRFEVMAFNTMPQMQFQQLENASDSSKQAAQQFLRDQRAVGGTSLRPAITTAYKYKDDDRPLNVVVLSDGMTEQQEQAELISLIAAAPEGTRVFCVGIGNEVNRPLLKQLAERAGGLAAFVSLQDDFRRQSQAFRRKLMRPVATGVTITIDGTQTYDVLPGELPDLFYGAPLRMIGRYKNAGKTQITVRAEVMGQPIEQTVQVELPENIDENPEIERMWAYSRVQQLMNEIREKGPSSTAEGEIVRLCEGFSIVSEYASFIVLENDAEYQRWSIQRRNATRVQRDDKARQRLQVELENMREQAMAALGPQRKNGQDSTISTNSSQSLSNNSPDPSAGTPLDLGTSNSPTSSPTDLVLAPPRSSDSTSQNISVPSSGGGGRRGGGGGGGGGAIDPISCLIALGLAGASALAARRRPPTSGV